MKEVLCLFFLHKQIKPELECTLFCTVGLHSYINHHHPWISVVKSVNDVYCFLKDVRPMFHDEYKTQG